MLYQILRYRIADYRNEISWLMPPSFVLYLQSFFST